jgi:hypothetical protein
VPLSRIQSEILRLLAEHRNPESYVAGAVPLNRDGPRYSDDIDIFHDREEVVAAAAEADVALLVAAGFTVHWLRREPGIHGAVVEHHGEHMRLEWARDSDFRFFPTIRDGVFGYVLHVIDIATNKALAAAGRREPRDVLDLLTGGRQGPGIFTGELDRAGDISQRLRAALNEAEVFVRAMPVGKEGLLFLQDGRPTQPDPALLGGYAEHAGRRHGHWPSSPEIGSAMLERYQ